MAQIKSGFMGERAIVLPISIIDEYKKTELGSLLHITDIGFYPKANFHYRKRTKAEVSQYILVYCVEGEGWFEINNQVQKVQANQAFILPKEVPHSYGSKSKKPWTIYWVHFDGEKAGFFADGFDKPLLILPEKDSRIEDRFKLFEEIFSTLKKGYSKSNLDFSVTSLFYFLGSLKYLGTYRACNNQNQNTLQRDIIEEAIHFMRENVRKRITLKEIAQYVAYSPSHFSGLFQRNTGSSPLNYFIHLKIQEACHQLDFSDMKINQISMLVGFEDPLYFSRMFSKIMGSSPSAYRKKKKG
ncbi:AraC family transcriptional regulator [Flavobacterium sp.]|uniref:AraC family transcriptional regulator n=1 Tax=Flavobacterium sp. TaxID=239 RepID=UPI00286E7C73|nr:AraC family transcriptional regulator [Flavobacterium sp.]